MPQLSLPEALRYFFSPFVIGFYFCLYDPATAKVLIKDFGFIPAIASLVAGITIYYVYRYCIYDELSCRFTTIFGATTISECSSCAGTPSIAALGHQHERQIRLFTNCLMTNSILVRCRSVDAPFVQRGSSASVWANCSYLLYSLVDLASGRLGCSLFSRNCRYSDIHRLENGRDLRRRGTHSGPLHAGVIGYRCKQSADIGPSKLRVLKPRSPHRPCLTMISS